MQLRKEKFLKMFSNTLNQFHEKFVMATIDYMMCVMAFFLADRTMNGILLRKIR